LKGDLVERVVFCLHLILDRASVCLGDVLVQIELDHASILREIVCAYLGKVLPAFHVIVWFETEGVSELRFPWRA
jgi:hypothetical protein